MNNQILLSAMTCSLFLLATGCGSSHPVAPSRFGTLAVSEVQAPAKADPGSVSALTTGSIRLVILDGGYYTQATVGDVASLQVVVTPSVGAPITKVVPKGSAVTIDAIPVGLSSISVTALNSTGQPIGSISSSNISISAGQTTTVSLTLKLSPTIVASGSLALAITLQDGDVILPNPGPSPSPSASPTPSPSPSPTPSATPSPSPSPSGVAFSDGFEAGLGSWTAAFTKAAYSTGPNTPTSNWNANALSAELGSSGATAGSAASGSVMDPGAYSLTLNSAVNTGGMTNPTLTFDFSHFVPTYFFKTTGFRVDTSLDGTSWTQAWAANAAQSSWAHTVVALPHSGTLRLRYVFTYDYYLGLDPMNAPYLDNVSISDVSP